MARSLLVNISFSALRSFQLLVGRSVNYVVEKSLATGYNQMTDDTTTTVDIERTEDSAWNR